MHIEKLKVRTNKKGISSSVLYRRDAKRVPGSRTKPCAYQLASMLGCWAATSDFMSTNACAGHAQALFKCMSGLVRLYFYFGSRDDIHPSTTTAE
jgi:hypothetical protein